MLADGSDDARLAISIPTNDSRHSLERKVSTMSRIAGDVGFGWSTCERRNVMRMRRCAIALALACGISGVVFSMPDHGGYMGTRGSDVYCRGYMDASTVPTAISIWLFAPNGALIDSSFLGQSGNKSLLVEAAGAKVGSGTYECHIEFDGNSDFDELDLQLNVS